MQSKPDLKMLKEEEDSEGSLKFLRRRWVRGEDNSQPYFFFLQMCFFGFTTHQKDTYNARNRHRGGLWRLAKKI